MPSAAAESGKNALQCIKVPSAARCGLFPAKWLKLSKGWRVNLVAYKPPESGFYQVGEWLEVAYVASFG